jgi:hypothetical protein
VTDGFGLTQVRRLRSSLILIRYLLPEDHGVMALANAIMIGLTLSSDIGSGQYLIQHRDGTT